MHKLIARGDTLDGKLIDHLDLGRDGASSQIIAFHARFTDGSSGIYYGYVIPEPWCASTFAWVTLLLMRRRG